LEAAKLAVATATSSVASVAANLAAEKLAAADKLAAEVTALEAARTASAAATTATTELAEAMAEQQRQAQNKQVADDAVLAASNALTAATHNLEDVAAAAAAAVAAALKDVGSADILIDAVDSATIPTLKTTNYETLKQLNTSANQTMYNNPPYNANAALSQITLNPAYNSIGSIAKIAEIFNDVEMHGAAGDAKVIQGWTTALATIRATTTDYVPKTITPGWNSRIGWNAAIQTQSTMLYVNVNAKLANGSVKNITLDLTTSLKPGDKILITDETPDVKIKKRQMWVVTKKPSVNPNYPDKVMNVPVSFTTARLTNLIRTILPGDDNIPNAAPLTVTFQHFTQDNLD
jgi:hypothetical protein